MLRHHLEVKIAAIRVRPGLCLHHLVGLVAAPVLSMDGAGLDLIVLFFPLSFLLEMVVIALVEVVLELSHMLTGRFRGMTLSSVAAIRIMMRFLPLGLVVLLHLLHLRLVFFLVKERSLLGSCRQ